MKSTLINKTLSAAAEIGRLTRPDDSPNIQAFEGIAVVVALMTKNPKVLVMLNYRVNQINAEAASMEPPTLKEGGG